jgi:hypothetical protein
VAARWSKQNRSYLVEAFQDVEQRQLFSKPDVEALSASGRIVVNTQKSRFRVDWSSIRKSGYGSIRTCDGRLAGSILLDDPPSDEAKCQEEPETEFIALAVINDFSSLNHYTNRMREFPTGTIYGCPCSIGSAKAQVSAHIAECAKSNIYIIDSFNKERSVESSSYQVGERKLSNCSDHEWAYFEHRKAMSFKNQAGDYLNSMWGVPEIKVMMIAPGPSSSDKGKVYRRLGIGRIWLKRWIESSPNFETVVLE